jgi:hypothetical protein
MTGQSVFGLAATDQQAKAVVQGLRDAGFGNDDISVLFPDTTGTRDFAHERRTKLPEGASSGAGTGGLVGGALGWLVGIGALSIPGLGPFVAAGPLMAALSGAAVGATMGGLTGALVGFGMPEFEAKRYEGKIRAGNILVAVHVESADERSRAEDVLEYAGAEDIATTGEARVS